MFAPFNRFCTLALAAGFALAGVGCSGDQAFYEPDVEWMLPSEDTTEVVEAPGLGASDALGHEIFTRHDDNLAQARLAWVLAAADEGTLWIDQIPGYDLGVAYDPFIDRFTRFAVDENEDAPVVTDVEGGFFDGAIND